MTSLRTKIYDVLKLQFADAGTSVMLAETLEPLMQSLIDAQAQAGLAVARAQALEEAENVFKDEYSKHDSPLIGVTRGLKAVRALPSDSTALAKLLAEERLEESGWWNRLLTPKEFREHRAEIDKHYAELGAARVAELKGEQK